MIPPVVLLLLMVIMTSPVRTAPAGEWSPGVRQEDEETLAGTLANLEDELKKIRRGRRVLSDRPEREILEDCIQVRSAILAADPDDPAVGLGWLQQAEDLFDARWLVEGARLDQLFAPETCSLESLEEALGVVLDMEEAIRKGSDAVNSLLRSIEQDPALHDDTVLQRRRVRLIEQEQEARVPLFNGILAVLQSRVVACGRSMGLTRRDQAWPSAWRSAADWYQESWMHGHLPDAAAGIQTGMRSIQGRRLAVATLYRALALSGSGQWDQASATFIDVAGTSEGVILEELGAELGQCELVQRRSGSASARQAMAEIQVERLRDAMPRDAWPWLDLLLADAGVHLNLEGEGPAAAGAGPVLGPYERLLKRNDPEVRWESVIGRRVDALLPLLEAKGVDRGRILAVEDPAVGLSWIRLLSANEERLAEATEGLEVFVAATEAGSVELGPRQRAFVSLLAGRNLVKLGRVDEAIDMFEEASREGEGVTEARAAIELALRAMAALMEQSPGRGEDHARFLRLQEILEGQFPTLARTDDACFRAGMTAFSYGEYSVAVRYLAQVDRISSVGLDALLVECESRGRLMDAATVDADRLREGRELLAIARNPVAAMGDRDPDDALAQLRIYEARASLVCEGVPRALQSLFREPAPEALRSTRLEEVIAFRIRVARVSGSTGQLTAALDEALEADPTRTASVLFQYISDVNDEVTLLLDDAQTLEAEILCREQLGGVVGALDLWLKQRGPAAGVDVADMHVLATSLLHLKRYEEALAAFESTQTGGTESAAQVFGRAECYFGIGDTPSLREAILLYKRLVNQRAAVDEGTWWMSQLRTLQILDRVNRNTEQIPGYVDNLRHEDRHLGSRRTRRGLESLQRKYE